MNELKIDLTKIAREAEAKAMAEAERQTVRIVSDVVSEHFRRPGEWQKKPGLAYEMIKRNAEDYIISEEFANKISTLMSQAADEAAQHAVQIVMKKLARKLAFGALNGED